MIDFNTLYKKIDSGEPLTDEEKQALKQLLKKPLIVKKIISLYEKQKLGELPENILYTLSDEVLEAIQSLLSSSLNREVIGKLTNKLIRGECMVYSKKLSGYYFLIATDYITDCISCWAKQFESDEEAIENVKQQLKKFNYQFVDLDKWFIVFE